MLNLNDWRVNIGDQCVVNGAMLNKIVQQCKLSVTEIGCISHGNCNSGGTLMFPMQTKPARGLSLIHI